MRALSVLVERVWGALPRLRRERRVAAGVVGLY